MPSGLMTVPAAWPGLCLRLVRVSEVTPVKKPFLSLKCSFRPRCSENSRKKSLELPSFGGRCLSSLLPTTCPGLVLPGQGRFSLAQAQWRPSGDSRNADKESALPVGACPQSPSPTLFSRYTCQHPQKPMAWTRAPREVVSHLPTSQLLSQPTAIHRACSPCPIIRFGITGEDITCKSEKYSMKYN